MHTSIPAVSTPKETGTPDPATKTVLAAAGSKHASDLATPEHIAQLTQQLSTLLTETVEHIAGLNREARILAERRNRIGTGG